MPKKSLGQNFLTSKPIGNTIVKTSNIKNGDHVLEIGAGKGFLTKILLDSGAMVVSFEKDDSLIPFLKNKFKDEIKNKKLKLIHKDIQKINKNIKNYFPKEYKIVANIPYNITGKLIRLFFSLRPLPKEITIMVQYEVAKRMVSSDKKGSILSTIVSSYGKPKYIKKVSKKNFNPKPKVDSAIIHIEKISLEFFKDLDEGDFFSFIKTGFSHKRKQLKNNLKIESFVFKKCKIREDSRAEELSKDNWKCLYKQNEL